ncbi:hypothetical protein BGZ74_000205 [Mortierella antarctica]|nr:hypothetical protein BGZ74_000205 [Mortierella antarctica]
METAYRLTPCVESMRGPNCARETYTISHCNIEVLDELLIELIPLKDVFKEIVCSSSTCQIVFEESVSASTTNSFEVSLSIDARAKPFGVGMTFASISEATTTLVYNIELVRGDRGYIGMAIAYLSAKMRVKGCIYPFNAREVGQCILHIVLLCERHEHETVITKNGVTRGLVAFVYTSLS